MSEKIYTEQDLQDMREQGSKLCDCWKTMGDKTCMLGEPEMYEHDGGISVEGQKEKQWVYFVCSRCKYQWSWTKILSRIDRAKREGQ